MPTRNPPLFITFEGPEGSGKSTQLPLLAERLRGHGLEVTATREPGGTRIGGEIRKILLSPENRELAPAAELLLMFASRAQNIAEVIRPALAQGQVVLCDRFSDSTVAYQGGAKGAPLEQIRELERMVSGGLRPTLTILIDIDPAVGLERARARNQQSGLAENRIDDEELHFHRKVRATYLELAAQEPERIRRVDGSGTREEIAEAIWKIVAPVVQLPA